MWYQTSGLEVYKGCNRQNFWETLEIAMSEITPTTKSDAKAVQTTEIYVEEAPRFKWRVVDTHSPKEIYNWRLYLCIAVFGLCGSMRGLDEGNTASTTLPSFQAKFGLDDPSLSEHAYAALVSNIKSMVQLGSILGSMISSYSVDKLGRVKSLQLVCFFMIIATIIQMTSKNVGQLYAGRFLEGALAVGLTVAIGPSYMSEVTPKAIRGMAGCMFAGAVYLGIMLSYFAIYGCVLNLPDDSNLQWITPLCVKIIIPGLILIGSFFAIESPRWLIKVGRNEEGLKALARLRNLSESHPFVIGEITDITESVQQELEAKRNNNFFGLFAQLVRVKSLRYRFFGLGCMVQLLGQWSGANSITIYASELFEFSGIKGNDQLKMTAILGVVKFCSAYIGAFFIIDFLGRRKAMYMGITIQLLAVLYFALFLLIVPDAAHEDTVLTTAQYRASQGAMAALYMGGVGWTIGFNSLQYLIGSEIFPLSTRTFAQSLIMVLHFANQYGNSKAVAKMLLTLQPYGTFFFFVAINAISLIWAWFFIPEISGRSLESMEELFSLPWYVIGRRGAKLCPDHSEINKMDYSRGTLRYLDDEKPSEEFIENDDHRESEEKDRDED
ncbi:hypothetical protein CANTEDRAFT_113792 [Yamadazyma tenuis ATCC 10573]|uniref:Major facilitator superfamily (MFS) profile domain-containing protein n=1 Tax=Candida tenuis (strain ATCC 10573 / BCRC 21748 / CBS 615 / JCM 9827 / NBRC 10315 / NRRL Y-1498 / VKM Y-70) TaxID=590646 RepID=G3B419_CANTC|nr:uncharacterized protein CANTEDRAFT_113792 [Yamadazyma tenuis ATCC 10573]EGV64233.1 hypothetical protein CANTEDRAFT_113792 [Yamadazyma tenuis ATCC 10573]